MQENSLLKIVDQYEFAEQEAKALKVGLWRDPEPVAPWDWRKGQR